MIIRLFFKVFLLSFCFFAWGSSRSVRIVVSELHASVVFLQKMTDVSQYKNIFQVYLEEQRVFDQKIEKIKKQYRKLKKTFPAPRSYGQSIQGREKTLSTEQWMTKLSAESLNREHFEKRLEERLSRKQVKEYLQILEEFKTPFRLYFYQKEKKDLHTIKQRLEQAFKKINFEGFLKSMEIFYDVSWPRSQDFFVALYPLPGKGGHRYAESIQNYESIGVSTKQDRVEDLIPIIIHELAHSLYHKQSYETQKAWKTWLNDVKNPLAGRFSERYVNEVFATLWGNALALKKLKGKLSKSAWYSDPRIDRFAQAFYPTFELQYEKKLGVDSIFLNKMKRVAEGVFYKEMRDLDSHYSTALVVSDSSFSKASLKTLLREEFRMDRLYFVESPPKDTWKALLHARDENLLIVLGPYSESFLKQTEGSIWNFKHDELLQASYGTLWSVFSKTGRLLTLVKLSRAKDLKKLFKKLKRTQLNFRKLNKVSL